MSKNTEEILQILNEECAEVIQSISKCVRFGFDSIKPNKGKTNMEILEEELGDLLLMVDLLVEEKVGITWDGLNSSKEQKLKKLKCWSNIVTS